jgi:hypothetical protein
MPPPKKERAASRPRRRSQRLLISARVTVRGESSGQTLFEEHTETVIVNSHGALLLLNAPVEIGQKLVVRHANTREEAEVEVISFGGRRAGKTQVGIQFQKPSPQFWRVVFPPDDWTLRTSREVLK